VVFRGGSAYDGDRPGLASLTADMLTQGAGDWDADEIAERMESVGAELSAGALRDMAFVSARSLTRQLALDTAVETLATVIARPTIAEADFRRVQENRLVGLRRDEQDPGTVGKKAVYRKIFGNHPYAADPAGTLESVAALTPDALQAFHQRYYVARNAVVAIVGAVSREQAEAIAQRVTAGLAGGEPPPPLPPVPELADDVTERLAFPSTQTHVYTGQPGMTRDDPDYFALYVGNHILGGSGLVSLLMEEVREKRGLTYGVSSYFLPMAQRGPFLMGLSTKNDQAEQAREVLMSTVRRFREEGPTQEELDAAVKNITGGFPLRIASNAKVVQYLAMIGFYGLPLDYLDRFNERVAAVTVDAIRDAFQRRLHPDRFATVIVGPGNGSVAKVGP
jgi:zinc protease